MTVRFLPLGDAALVVEFGETIARALSERVLGLSRRLDERKPAGVVETLPTFRSLLICYDPLVTTGANLEDVLRDLLDEAVEARGEGRLWRVPACYEGPCAPDLAEVAERTGLQREEVIALHAETQFHVYMLGFAPGFPYMGDLPARLALPRRLDPRLRVPPGSIAIATSLTAIYPVESPGGWHLIGATPIRLFNPRWEKPSLLSPGDAVRFEPISLADHERLKEAVVADTYVVPSEARAR